MPSIKFLASERRAYVIAVILLLGKIIRFYSCCKEKKLVCIIIIAPFSHQLSSYSECIKSNIHSSCNVRLVSNAKYIFISFYNIHNLSQLLSRNTWWCMAFLTLYYIY